MDGGDLLSSDQVKRLVQDLEGRNESRWKRETQHMFEEVLRKVLEEVLTRKLREVGLGAARVNMREHRENDRQSPKTNVRSWAAGKIAKTLERPPSASSNSESIVHSVASWTERCPYESPRMCEVECTLPSCTTCEESIRSVAAQDQSFKRPHFLSETNPPVFVSQSPGVHPPMPKDQMQMSVASSTASARLANTPLFDFAHDPHLSAKSPTSSTVAPEFRVLGHVPKAWDPSRSEKTKRFARSYSTQSLSSLFSDPKHNFSSIRERFTRQAMKQKLPARYEHSSFVRLVCATIVMHQRFDFAVSVVILANAVTMGVSADRQAKQVTEVDPPALTFLENVFFALFVGELLLRLNAYRWQFFHGPDCSWNIFDFLVVGSQLVESILSLVGSGSQALGLTGVLRLLRLIRIIRLARILRLIKELRVLVSSISNSMKSLVWTLILMVLMIYSVSLCITQLVTDKRLSVKISGGSELEDLVLYYGSLPRSMLSLFEAITGGVDWDVVVMPLLQEVHPILALIFVVYVAVALLAIMNVVTGVFVDSVLASARADKEQYLLNNAKELFATAEEEMDWETFNGKMDTPQMLEFFKGIDVDPSEAKDIFALIDLDQSGSINADEFLNGCVRLQGPSKALETAVLLQELKNLRRDLFRIERSL